MTGWENRNHQSHSETRRTDVIKNWKQKENSRIDCINSTELPLGQRGCTECKESFRSPPILIVRRCDEAISYLFNNILSPFSMTHTSRFMQLWKTFYTSSKVSSYHTFVNASSISSLELNSRSFKTPFNIPKSQKSQGLMSGEWSGCDNRET
jgi:hypothetical protein